MNDDFISRQAAIRSVCEKECRVLKPCNAECGSIIALRELPFIDVQPVVRCKDCKHSTEWYGDKRRCFLWCEDGIDVFEDGFCNYWDRKDDKQKKGMQ